MSGHDDKSSRRQIVFNWLMCDDTTKLDGWWGGSEDVARVDELLAALDAALPSATPAPIEQVALIRKQAFIEAAVVCENRAAAWDSSVREGSEQRAYEETVLMECAAILRNLACEPSAPSHVEAINAASEPGRAGSSATRPPEPSGAAPLPSTEPTFDRVKFWKDAYERLVAKFEEFEEAAPSSIEQTCSDAKEEHYGCFRAVRAERLQKEAEAMLAEARDSQKFLHGERIEWMNRALKAEASAPSAIAPLTPDERKYLAEWHDWLATMSLQSDDYGGERHHKARAAELRATDGGGANS